MAIKFSVYSLCTYLGFPLPILILFPLPQKLSTLKSARKHHQENDESTVGQKFSIVCFQTCIKHFVL